MTASIRDSSFLGLLLLAVTGCGESSNGGAAPPSELPRVASTRGGALVLSRDERVAVATNRSAGVVTVFRLDPAQPADLLVQGKTAIDFGQGSEPWAAVIGADDDTAYVISRRDQTLRRIVELRDNPHIDDSETLKVGSEPTAISITPSGAYVFVANWAEGTISVITTQPLLHRSKVDLNVTLADTRLLGDYPGRPGLAHPRALAMTDDGDAIDDGETLYATEFYSQPMLPEEVPEGPTEFDRNRQGIVYAMNVVTGQVDKPILIKPIASTGFYDSTNMARDPGDRRETSCFPNQLYSAAVAGNQLLVTSMCASPSGPVGPDTAGTNANFKTIAHPVVFQIDTRTNTELPDHHRVLTRELEPLYEEDGSGEVRMPLIPNDIVVTRSEADGVARALLTAFGADAIFSLVYDDAGSPLSIGRAGQRFIDLRTFDPPGRLPIGVAVLTRTDYSGALVLNDTTQSLAVIDLSTGFVAAAETTASEIPHAEATRTSSANRGRELFATGLDVWSFQGQAWNSCETCHPDGLSDGLTWFFPRGPRRTLSAAGTYVGGRRRVMLWTGNIDEVHDIEAIVRGVAGGTGAIVWDYPGGRQNNALRITYDGKPSPDPQNGPKPSSTLLNNLSGSLAAIVASGRTCITDDNVCDNSPVTDWNDIDAFIATVRAPRRPTDLIPEEVDAGERLFQEARCAGCHSGPAWTQSEIFYPLGAPYNGALPYTRPAALTPEQLGRLRTEKYLVPPELRPLNTPGATGEATFRRWDPPIERDPIVHLYGQLDPDGYDSSRTHGSDQINCVLRTVGTFPVQPPAPTEPNRKGIVADGAPPVREVRQDMATLGLGDTGFNIPSLFGLSLGAPYFHAGNARSLEEVFAPEFAAHHQALSASFLGQPSNRSQQIRELIQYLLSIDEDTPQPGTDILPFNPNLCGSFFASAEACAGSITECKNTLVGAGACTPLADCACGRCACPIAACDDVPGCRALIRCAMTAGCCTSSGCNNSQCQAACPTEFSAAFADTNGIGNLALAVDSCVFLGSACSVCPTAQSH